MYSPRLFFVLILPLSTTLLLGSACKSTRIFSEAEQQLILAGDKDEPMRVFLITDRSDSLLLRQESKPIPNRPEDRTLQHFKARLLATVQDSATQGVGIAAPQVGILKRIIWVQRLDKEDEPFEVYYNPEIVQYSQLKQDVPEGCLSIPDFRAMTQDRAYAIFLTYLDAQGEERCEMVEAFTAAIFQHEIDHLNGILFTDHLESERKRPGKHGY